MQSHHAVVEHCCQQLPDPLLSRGVCKGFFAASASLSASMADCLLHSIRSASEVAFSRHACRSGDSPLLLQAAVSPVSNRRDRRAFMGCEQGCSCTSQGSTKKHHQLPDDPLLSSGECWVGGEMHSAPPPDNGACTCRILSSYGFGRPRSARATMEA